MKNRFYLACFRENVGTNVGFHGIDGRGYFTDIRKAHVYTREEAQRAWEQAREYDQPISADHVDANTVFKVDCQYIPRSTTIDENETKYVAYVDGSYNGNDVYFVTKNGGRSFEFNENVKMFGLDEVDETGTYLVFIPCAIAQANKRPTFDFSKLNKRNMIQGAGLKTPEHIKRSKRRKLNPMIRWNCPICGKIRWQYNPHDFEGCSDLLCDS